MPIDPSISMGYRGIEVPNPLNQLAQVSQIQASQRQGEVAQMQLEDLKNDRIEMAAFQRDTGLTTPQAIATLMRNPKTRGQAIELQMKYKQQLQADKFLRDRYPGLPSLFGEEGAAAPAAAPMTAPAAAAQIEPTGAQVGGPIAAPNVMAAPLAAPRNAMATPAAAPTAAPANALAAPPTQGAASPTGRTRQELEYTIELAKMNPYLAGAGEVAKLELAEMLKTPPDLATMRALNIPATEAGFTKFQRLKENPGEFARTLDRLDLPPAQRRAIEMQYAQKLATHAPSAQQNVFAYTPASVEAQKQFIQQATEERKSLRNAPDVLANTAKARTLIPGAKGFMGTGGEPLLKTASFLNNRLGFTIDTKGVADASELRTRLFDGIMDNLKRLDSQPSQEQQRVMQEALGTLGTDPNALPRILDKIDETVRARVARYNEDVTEAERRNVKFPFKPQIELPEAPAGGGTPAAPAAAGKPPAGIDAALWNVMTPQERALWQK